MGGMGTVVTRYKMHPRIHLVRLRKAMRNLSKGTPCGDRDPQIQV